MVKYYHKVRRRNRVRRIKQKTRTIYTYNRSDCWRSNKSSKKTRKKEIKYIYNKTWTVWWRSLLLLLYIYLILLCFSLLFYNRCKHEVVYHRIKLQNQIAESLFAKSLFAESLFAESLFCEILFFLMWKRDTTNDSINEMIQTNDSKQMIQ